MNFSKVKIPAAAAVRANPLLKRPVKPKKPSNIMKKIYTKSFSKRTYKSSDFDEFIRVLQSNPDAEVYSWYGEFTVNVPDAESKKTKTYQQKLEKYEKDYELWKIEVTKWEMEKLKGILKELGTNPDLEMRRSEI